jgi:hypothetical protein
MRQIKLKNQIKLLYAVLLAQLWVYRKVRIACKTESLAYISFVVLVSHEFRGSIAYRSAKA